MEGVRGAPSVPSKDVAEDKSGKNLAAVSAKRESVLGLPLEAYQSRKERLVRGFLDAARFLRRESFFSKKDLPYRTQVVPHACMMSLLGDRWLDQVTYKKLARWYWSGVLGELYGGAVETRIANDLQQVMAWIEGSDELPTTVNEANSRQFFFVAIATVPASPRTRSSSAATPPSRAKRGPLSPQGAEELEGAKAGARGVRGRSR